MPICGVSTIERIYNRVTLSERLDEVIVATSNSISDDELADFCMGKGGSLNNVLERYYECARTYEADVIVRLTGDNVLIDPKLIDNAIEEFCSFDEIDYLKYRDDLPLGMGIEVFSWKALEKAYNETDNDECKEHVTLYMYREPERFKCVIYHIDDVNDNSQMRWTMDTGDDYKFVTSIYEIFGNRMFYYDDVLNVLEENPNIAKVNVNVHQKETAYGRY